MKLSGSQKLVRFFSSKEKFEKIKTESKMWGFNCDSCDNTSSIWEVGGIRYKAKGNPSIRLKCPLCKKIGMQKIRKLEV